MPLTSHPSPLGSAFAAMLRLALPIVFVQVGGMMMGVVDTLMVGHVSPGALAAVALGNVYFVAVSVIGNGVLMVLDPVVAQAVGAHDHEAVARAVQRGIALAIVLTLASSPFFPPAAAIFALLRQPAEVIPSAARYVALSLPGLFPFFGFIVLRQSLQAIGRVTPIVVTIVAANLSNVFLNWVFIYGHLGSPPLGVAGSAIATSVSRWASTLLLAGVSWPVLREYLVPVRPATLALRPFLRLVRLGLPIGFQFELEYGVFAAVALLMGRLGTVPMAAHQVAVNLAALTWMVPFGISAAAAVLVGNAIGRGDHGEARRAALAGLACGVAFMCVSALVFLAAPGLLARLYSNDTAVVALAASLIPIAGIFQVFDGTQAVAAGVLRGAGDTRAPLVINVLGFWLVGFPASAWLAFGAGAGPRGLWWGFVAGLAAVALLLLARVRTKLRGEIRRLHIDEPALSVER